MCNKTEIHEFFQELVFCQGLAGEERERERERQRQRQRESWLFHFNFIVHARIQTVISEGVQTFDSVFLVGVGEGGSKYHYKQAIIGQPAKRHLNLMAEH